MLKDLNLNEYAPWKQRFRAQSILWAELANLNSQRGVVCTDRDGIFQLFAWDVASNDTRCPARQMQAFEERLRSSGKQIDVYWFEAGHGIPAQEQQIEDQQRKLQFAYQVLDGQ